MVQSPPYGATAASTGPRAYDAPVMERMLAVSVSGLLVAACSGAPIAFTPDPQTCLATTPAQATWPAHVLDFTIASGVLLEIQTFGDGRETVGRWSVAELDVEAVAQEIRSALNDAGFVLEGTPDDITLAYARAATGQVIEATAARPDACGRVVVTLDSIAGDVPDPRPSQAG